jgi:hypothetical protein
MYSDEVLIAMNFKKQVFGCRKTPSSRRPKTDPKQFSQKKNSFHGENLMYAALAGRLR